MTGSRETLVELAGVERVDDVRDLWLDLHHHHRAVVVGADPAHRARCRVHAGCLQALAEIENEWAAVAGAEALTRLRDGLSEVRALQGPSALTR
jgi:hypothetical protein